MDETHKPMSWEEFLAYPRKLGWKYEYFGGALHLSPSWTAVATFYIALDSLQPLHDRAMSEPRTDFTVRPVEPTDHESLLSLFCQSFSGTIDYAGTDSMGLLRYSHHSLDHFFGLCPTAYFNSCRIALEQGTIAGCCMIDSEKMGPVLQPIFVAPGHQRRGIATRLLYSALQSLTGQSVNRMFSKCNLGNEASVAWHLQCGFKEIPNQWTAGHRANIYSQEAERQQFLKLPTATAMKELARYWTQQSHRLAQ